MNIRLSFTQHYYRGQTWSW